jgi:hypothetical protein
MDAEKTMAAAGHRLADPQAGQPEPEYVPLALIEGPGCTTGWGSRKLFAAGLAEIERAHREEYPEERAAAAAMAQAYAFLALGRADPTVQEQPPAARGPAPVTPDQVRDWLLGFQGESGEPEVIARVLYLMAEAGA